MNEKIETLILDENFRAEAENVTSVEELIKLFKSKNVDVTMDELIAYIKMTSNEQNDDEIGIEQLEYVSGGSWYDYLNPGYWLGRLLKKKTGVCAVDF